MSLSCPSCSANITDLKHFCYECGVQFELDEAPKIIAKKIPEITPPGTEVVKTSSILNAILLAAVSFLILQSNDKESFTTFLIITVISVVMAVCNFFNNKSAVFCSSFLALGLQPPVMVLALFEIAKKPQILTSLIPLIIILSYLITAIITIITAYRSIKVIAYVAKDDIACSLDEDSFSPCSTCNAENLNKNNFCCECGQIRLDDFQQSIVRNRQKNIHKLTLFSISITWALIVAGAMYQNNIILTVLISQMLIFLVSIVAISTSAQYKNLLKMIMITPAVLKSSGYALIILTGALILNYIFSGIYNQNTRNFLSNIFFESKIQPFVIVFILCILPGVLEEIAFRGFLQNQLKSIFGNWSAIIISSTVFGIIHFQGLGIIYIFLLSLGLGWIFNKTQSLIPCVVIHSLHNFVVLLIAVMQNG